MIRSGTSFCKRFLLLAPRLENKLACATAVKTQLECREVSFYCVHIAIADDQIQMQQAYMAYERLHSQEFRKKYF